MIARMTRTAILIAALGLGCGPTDSGDAGSGDATSGDSDGTATGDPSASDTSGADGSSGGEEPIDLCDTTLAMGISGLAITYECDAGPPEECQHPGAGRAIAAFTEDPRLEIDESFPSELDPAILPVAQTEADADGRFELPLAAGTWVLCAVSGGDGFCRTDVVIDDTQPLRTATHESGNGDSWSIGTCPAQ